MNKKLEHIIVEYLNKQYGDLTEYKIDDYSNSIFYIKDKKVYMEQDIEEDVLWVSYDKIWSDLENLFSLNYNEIRSIITKWVEVVYNIRGIIPFDLSNGNYKKVEEVYNLRKI